MLRRINEICYLPNKYNMIHLFLASDPGLVASGLALSQSGALYFGCDAGVQHAAGSGVVVGDLSQRGTSPHISPLQNGGQNCGPNSLT